MLKTIFKLENGEVPDRKAERWRVEERRKESQGRNVRG